MDDQNSNKRDIPSKDLKFTLKNAHRAWQQAEEKHQKWLDGLKLDEHSKKRLDKLVKNIRDLIALKSLEDSYGGKFDNFSTHTKTSPFTLKYIFQSTASLSEEDTLDIHCSARAALLFAQSLISKNGELYFDKTNLDVTFYFKSRLTVSVAVEAKLLEIYNEFGFVKIEDTMDDENKIKTQIFKKPNNDNGDNDNQGAITDPIITDASPVFA